jgi:hypothetical protein
MSNNKQSSVEWLVEQIKKDINLRLRGFDIDKALEQAKKMHKTEHFNTWWHGISENEPITFDQYYNETFGGNND